MYQKSITDTSSIMHELRGRDLDGLRLIMHATNGRKFADNDFIIETDEIQQQEPNLYIYSFRDLNYTFFSSLNV